MRISCWKRCALLVALGMQFPSEQRGVGEQSFNALRFAGAAGQFTGVPTVQLSVIAVVVALKPPVRVNLCC